MSHLDILLPFGLPRQELAADLFRELKVPALATLLSRSNATRPQESFEGFQRALPHETWIARRFGLQHAMNETGSPPVAGAVMREFGVSDGDGTWFIVNPVHIHIARDHLVLTDPRQLRLPEQDSRALFGIAKGLFEEAGKTLLYGNAKTWFARADDWSHLQTSTPDAASGHNIDIWMPRGEGERNWRKLQNEVQMHWFAHPVNAAREAAGMRPVNSIWLWAGSPAPMRREASPYTDVFGLAGWTQALAQSAGARIADGDASNLTASAPERGLLLLDALQEPALAGDWAQWLAVLRQLETDWFHPLLAALKAGKVGQLSLVLTDDARVSTYTTTRNSLRKFWVKPSLAPLLP